MNFIIYFIIQQSIFYDDGDIFKRKKFLNVDKSLFLKTYVFVSELTKNGVEMTIDEALTETTMISALTGLPSLNVPFMIEENEVLNFEILGPLWTDTNVLSLGNFLSETLKVVGSKTEL